MTSTTSSVAVCVPTVDRPAQVRRLLESLLEQQRPPDIVMLVDASETSATADVCRDFASRFPPSTLVHECSSRGLTLQRRRAIEMLKKVPDVRYVCFLDDDVVLADGFLRTAIDFLDSDTGRSFGGISGYDLAGNGKPFERVEVLYNRLGLFEGPLRPGRWLYCGYFLELDRLPLSDEIHESDFLLGGATIWRREVFDHFLPPLAMGSHDGEDKHFSLRVHTRFRLGVHGGVRMRHLHGPGGRPGGSRLAYRYIRTRAILLRDCDPRLSLLRYLAFLGFNLLHLVVRLGTAIGRRHFGELENLGWSALGWLSCVVFPPRRTQDALEQEQRK